MVAARQLQNYNSCQGVFSIFVYLLTYFTYLHITYTLRTSSGWFLTKQPIKKNYISLRPEIMFSYMRVFDHCILIPTGYFKKSRDA